MLRNEYGAVQQHLEPIHIADMIIPVPNNWNSTKDLVQMIKIQFEMKELLESGAKTLEDMTSDLMLNLIKKAQKNDA